MVRKEASRGEPSILRHRRSSSMVHVNPDRRSRAVCLVSHHLSHYSGIYLLRLRLPFLSPSSCLAILTTSKQRTTFVMTLPSADSPASYTLPGTSASRLRSSTSSPGPARKQWQTNRTPSFHSSRSQPQAATEQEVVLSHTQSRTSTIRQWKWWKIRLFRGMISDVRRRAPFYWSDWSDAWNYRVVPATIYMYFAKYDQNLRLLIVYCKIPSLAALEHFESRSAVSVSSIISYVTMSRSHSHNHADRQRLHVSFPTQEYLHKF
jgi:hypothetical protein